MTWEHPSIFVLVPLAIAVVWWVFRLGNGDETLFTLQNIKRLWADRQGLKDAPAARRRRARGLFLGLGVLGTLLALARPQWGSVPETTYDQAREVLIALDLSRSMLADDVSPTRLARAKLLVESLLDRLRGERVGLVVFAGTSFLQSPMSADYEVLRDFLAELQPEYMPQGGTDYHTMLTTAVKAFGQEGDGDRFLVVLSDGEAHDDQWKEMIPALRERGIRVIGLGVGTPDGALLPDVDGGLMKDDKGAAVLSKLEPKTLQELAEATGGTYRDAATWVDIAQLVQVTVDQGQKGRYVEEKNTHLQDRYQWFLAPAVVVLLLSYWIDFPLFPVARRLSFKRAARAGNPIVNAAAAALLLVIGVGSAKGAPSPAPAAQVNPLESVVAELAAKPDLGAGDYAALAKTTIDVASQPDKISGPSRLGVIEDALAGVDAGERLDARAADWPALRQKLEELKQVKQDPPDHQQQQQKQEKQKQDQSKGGQQSQPQQSQDGQGESKQQQGGVGNSEQQNAENQPQGGGGEQQQNPQQQQQQQGNSSAAPDQGRGKGEAESRSQQDRARDADGKDEEQVTAGATQQPQHDDKPGEQKAPKALKSADAGFGDQQRPPDNLLGKEGEKEKEGEKQPATRMVGGGRAQDPAASSKDLALVDALDRMNRIKDGDAPAVLFDRMNQAEGQRPPEKNGKNW